MPIADPLERKKYQREYMRRWRARRKAERAIAKTESGLFEAARIDVPAQTPQPHADPAREIATWAQSTLRVPTGPLRGQPFVLDEWQIEWLRGALAPATRQAGLSIARKNGKSSLVAVLCLAFLNGPLNHSYWRGVVASLTGELAKELRHLIEATAATGSVDIDVRRSPQPGHILGRDNSRLDFLNAEKSSGHAGGWDLSIIDEAGLLPESKRQLWSALASSVSGRDGRMLAISVRGDGPMFAELADRADDPAVHWVEYAASESAALDDPAAWIAANPGLATSIKSRRYMEDQARMALGNPADQAAFRSLDLNQPVNPGRHTIVTPSDWVACVAHDGHLPDWSGQVVVGFDLGGSSSMSALVAIDTHTRRMIAWGAFSDTPDLLARGQGDGCGGLYERMADRGELWTYPGRVVPADRFLTDCADRLRGMGLTVIEAAADRYRRAEVEQAMMQSGIGWHVDWQWERRQHVADVRAFTRQVLTREIATPESLLMESAIANSAVHYDSAMNPLLDKAKARGRIDALSAAVLASGLAEQRSGSGERFWAVA